MKYSMRNALAFSFSLMLCPSVLDASITIDKSVLFRGGNPSTGTINAFGADKIVVIATGEHGFKQTANGDGRDVTLNGVVLTKAVNRNSIKAQAGPPVVLVDDTWNDIWYLDASDFPGGAFPDSELTVSAAAVSRACVTVLALSGTAPGVGNVVVGDRDNTSAELTTTGGSIVVFSYAMGGTGNTAFVNNVTLEETMTEVGRQNNGGGRWWDGHVVAYQSDVVSGTRTYSVTDTSAPGADGRTGAHLIAAEFLASGAVSGGGLTISDISYAKDTNQVTLTWPKAGLPSYTVKASTDLVDWEFELEDSITDESDLNPEDPAAITVTLPIPLDFQDSSQLFFRLEAGQ